MLFTRTPPFILPNQAYVWSHSGTPLVPYHLSNILRLTKRLLQDILVALGVVELPIRQFGLEAAGIITRVGEGVDPEQLAVGDRVFCLKKQAYSTYITTPTVFCTRIPDDLGFDEAASMLMPYVTAIHGLVNVAHLSKGQVSETLFQTLF